MMTVDDLLLKIVNFTEPSIEESLPGRDSRVLRSLANAINTHYFITENQSRLLLKILRENQKKLPTISEELSAVLNAPTWSKKFRKIEQVKKLFIGTDTDGELCIFVEFTFSSQIRKILQGTSRQIENLFQVNPGKLYTAELTEKNIVNLVELLTPYDFTIDELVKNHYNTIKSWSETEVRNQFTIENITNQNFQRAITNDLGLSTAIDKNIINDRSVRYQFFTENDEKSEKSLIEHIATRQQPRVWLDSNRYDLTEIINTLKELHRLPLLIIFPNWEGEKLVEIMKNLSKSLDANNIVDDIGIYFRLSNDGVGKDFNQFIGEHKYNTHLTERTKIVGIQTGKVPKFLIKSGWTPMSIISLDNNLRYNKASVYASCCDLVVTHTDKPSLLEQRII